MTFDEMIRRAEHRFARLGLALPSRIVYKLTDDLIDGVEATCTMIGNDHALIRIYRDQSDAALQVCILHELLHAHSITLGKFIEWLDHPEEFNALRLSAGTRLTADKSEEHLIAPLEWEIMR